MYCGKCGKKLPENSKFCGFCGSKIANLEIEQISKEKTTKSNMKKSKKVIIGVVTILVLMAIIFIKYKANISGPHIDKYFVNTFPFTSGSMSAVENWAARNKDYKVKENNNLPNNQIELIYKSNSAWKITGCNEVYGIEGFYLEWCFSFDFFNPIGLKSVYESVFESVVDELMDICGSPVDIRGNGDVYEFDYSGLTIIVSLDSDCVMLRMGYYIK